MPPHAPMPSALQALVTRATALDASLGSELDDTLQRLLRAATALAWARDRAPRLAAAAGDPQALLEAVVDEARTLTEAPEVWALGWSGKGARTRIEALAGGTPGLEGRPLAPEALSASLVGEVVEAGRPAWSDDAASDARYAASRSIAAMSLRSVGCLPLGPSAVLYLADPDTPGRFGADARSRLSALCSLAGAFLAPPPASEVATEALPGVVGATPPMLALARRVRAFAPMPWPMLVLGETGTGKERVAQAIHALGPTASGPFVAVNCGAIPDSLAESTLFGHVRGAFTGADRDREGLVSQAEGGTLFLDEVGELSAANQVRLLRLLQEQTYQRVGDTRVRRFAGRVVAATHRPVEGGSEAFRADLYHRLSACVVHVPPLRERRDDVPALARHALRAAAEEVGLPTPELAPDALAELARRPWGGNVRELINALRGGLAQALADDSPQIRAHHLHDPFAPAPARSDDGGMPFAELDLQAATDAYQRLRVEAALEAAGGNKSEAARSLGVSRQWFHRLLARWDGEA